MRSAAARRAGRAVGGSSGSSVRRRIAVATWRPSTDGRIYARVELDATAMLAYLEQARSVSGLRISLTHVVGAALGRAMRAAPELRSRVVLSRILERESCDVGFAVDIDGGYDLAPVKVCGIDRLTPAEVASQLLDGAARLRAGRDRPHRRTSRLVRFTPTWLLRALMPVTGLFVGGFGVAAFGQPGLPLGSAFVSNVGSLGLDEAFLAPLPFARVPLYLAIGSVSDAAMVVDGQVVVRPRLVAVATADHRLIDGAHAGQIMTIMRGLLADPWQLDHAAEPQPGQLDHAAEPQPGQPPAELPATATG
jgi:pyruvate/2-oxoglutarate dehydrogenase complex dihydrolipoamide acyltransferase (E2) component